MRRLVLAKRTLGSLRSEKTIVLALAIQLFIAAFSSFLVVGLVSLYDPGTTGDAYQVNVGVTGNATGDLAPVVERGDTRDAFVYESSGDAMTAFRDGQVDAVLDATRHPSGRVVVSAVAPEGSFRTTFVVSQVKAALSEFERDQRDGFSQSLSRQPLALPADRDANPYFSFTYTVLLPLLSFLPAFISGSVMADTLAEEAERGTLELLRVAPLTLPEIVDGKALALVALAPAQVALWLALLAYNGTAVSNPLAVLALVTGAAAVLVAGGAALALGIGARREAQLLYSFTALAAFGLASLLPQSPQNLVARLAVGSPNEATWLSLAAVIAAAAAGYACLRWLAGASAD